MKKKPRLIYSAAALTLMAIATLLIVITHSRGAGPYSYATSAQALAKENIPVAGPGLVEPASEEVLVGSSVPGKLRTVLVQEGDRLDQGQLVAELENDDIKAQVASSEATLREKQADLEKLLNGARDQERLQALASLKEAESTLQSARADIDRRRQLYAEGVVSKSESDQYDHQYKVAKARYDAASEAYALIMAPPRPEDRARAEADVALAQAQLEQSRATLEKTLIRSPIRGIVLRKFHRPGEIITNSLPNPDAIISVGDTAKLRVRMEVDESDVGRVHAGQRAFVTADAFPGQRFWGRVVRVGEELGPKNIQTDNPRERQDTKVLETLLELDDGHQLPVRLRVNSFILANDR